MTQKPWWKSRTYWAVVISALSGTPVIINAVVPLLTPEQAAPLLAVSGIAAAVASVFGRIAGINAAEEVREDLSPTYVIPIEPGQ